tara:strand:- start:375 stop:554 length:180 start_codon:yes stop_codon:yes gene_type:complete
MLTGYDFRKLVKTSITLFLFGAMALDTVVVKILVYFLIDLQYFGMSFRCEAEYRQKKGM